MRKKRLQYKFIVEARIYRLGELADECRVSFTTIWNWVQRGLPVIDLHKKPWLFVGKTCKQFFKDYFHNEQTVKLLPHQFYCFRCDAAVTACSESVTLIHNGYIKGSYENYLIRILGQCDQCGLALNRFSSKEHIKPVLDYYQIDPSLLNTLHFRVERVSED